MKKLFILSTAFILVSCYNQERNCKDFMTGKFEFVQEINGKETKSVFERKDGIQIENFNGKTDTASVRWISDCEFILTKMHPKNMQEKKAIGMKILSTNDKGYSFEYGFVNDPKKQRGFVTKTD